MSHQLCPADCRNTGAGHGTHWIQCGLITRSPQNWHDAVVTAVDGGEVSLHYIDLGIDGVARHHADLSGVLAVGDPVSVHSTCLLLVGDKAYSATLHPCPPERERTSPEAGIVMIYDLAKQDAVVVRPGEH